MSEYKVPSKSDLRPEILRAYKDNAYNPFVTATDIVDKVAYTDGAPAIDWSSFSGGAEAFLQRVRDTLVTAGIDGALDYAISTVSWLLFGQHLATRRQASVTFSQLSVATAIIELPENLPAAEGNPDTQDFLWDWYDKHHEELTWSHDGLDPEIENVEETEIRQ